MTKEEIQHEALLDFLEMKVKMEIAFGDFQKKYNRVSEEQHVLHSIVETKTIRTRRRNTWNIRFHIRYHKPNEGPMVGGMMAYIPLHRGDETDFLFLKGTSDFLPELVSAHFMQRYKERYLDPHKINTMGMPPAVYFQRCNNDMRPTDYYPENWDDAEKSGREVWLSNQGLFVTKRFDKMLVFITFLDQENLTRYKATIYEEESLMRLYHKANEANDPLLLAEILTRMFNTPNAHAIHERYVRRTTDYSQPDAEERIQKRLDSWRNLEECATKVKEIINKAGMDACRKHLKLPEIKLPESFNDF